MRTRNIKIIMFLGSKVRRVRRADNLGSNVRRVRRADNLTTILANCLDNVGSLTSHNPIGLHCLLRGYLYFFTEQLYHVWQGFLRRYEACLRITGKHFEHFLKHLVFLSSFTFHLFMLTEQSFRMGRTLQ
jgi:hypothetical protein